MLGNLMNIFFDGTLEESSERQVRETTPDVMEKSSTIAQPISEKYEKDVDCLLYTSPSPRDRTRSRMPSSA